MSDEALLEALHVDLERSQFRDGGHCRIDLRLRFLDGLRAEFVERYDEDLASRAGRVSYADRGVRAAGVAPGGVAQSCVQRRGCATASVPLLELGQQLA